MKQIILMILILLCVTPSFSSEMKVFFIHSYEIGNVNSEPLVKEFKKIFNDKKTPINIKSYYLHINTKYRTSRDTNYLIDKITSIVKDFDPDFVIVVQDEAFSLIGIPLIFSNYNVISVGNVLSKEYYLQKFAPLKAYNFLYIEEDNFLSENFIDLTKDMEQFNYWYIVYDKKPISREIFKSYSDSIKKSYENATIKGFQIENYEEFLSAIFNIIKQENGVILLNLQNVLLRGDNFVDNFSLINKILEINKKHIEISTNLIGANSGFLIGYGINYKYNIEILYDYIIKNKTGNFTKMENSIRLNIKRNEILGVLWTFDPMKEKIEILH